MKSTQLLVWTLCLIQIWYPVICDSNSLNTSSKDSNSMMLKSSKPSKDLGTANSDEVDEEDAAFLKNCSGSKIISKRDTDRRSQLDDDKYDSSNNGTGDTSRSPTWNSSKNLHKIPLTFSNKEEGNSSENQDKTTTTGSLSIESNSSEQSSSTNNQDEQDIIILPLPPRPIFIELIFFRANKTSHTSNGSGSSIGNFKNTDSSSENMLSPLFSVLRSNETGSNLTRPGPHGASGSDMKGSSERDETTGLEHVRLGNLKTRTTPTLQTTASLDDGNNEDAVFRSTRNADDFNSVQSSSTILGNSESSSHFTQKITPHQHSSTRSPLDIGGQGLRHKSINSDEDASTHSSSGPHMPVTISESELRGNPNRGESQSSTTASSGLGNRRRRDIIFSHLTNNSHTGSSEDGKHSSEKNLMMATSTTWQKGDNTTATDSNLPNVSAGESLEVITVGSSAGTDKSKGMNSTSHKVERNKGIIAAFMEILGIGGVDDNNKTGSSEASNGNSTKTITPSNSNHNSSNSSSDQGRRVSRAANGPAGNSNPSSSPSTTSSTPNSVSSTSKPDEKSNSGSNESNFGSAFIPPPLLNVPSAGRNGTKFHKTQHN